VTHAFAKGGRWPYQAPSAPVPELPAAEAGEVPGTEDGEAISLSGIDPRFDQRMVQLMQEGKDGGDVLWPVASLSRISQKSEQAPPGYGMPPRLWHTHPDQQLPAPDSGRLGAPRQASHCRPL
jgi:hypothetical protein